MSNINYTSKWDSIIDTKATIGKTAVKPGNFYKLTSYTYADGKTRPLSGPNTSYIFVIGQFTKQKTKYIATLKLKSVNPEWFFSDIKSALKQNPLVSSEIDKIYEEKSPKKDTFRWLLRKFPVDGKPLFEIIKRKRRVYNGNYREYILGNIKGIEYIEIDSEYLFNILTKGSDKVDRKKEREEKLNS